MALIILEEDPRDSEAEEALDPEEDPCSEEQTMAIRTTGPADRRLARHPTANQVHKDPDSEVRRLSIPIGDQWWDHHPT